MFINEIKKMCERLVSYVQAANENPDSKELAKKNCLDEIGLAEILISAKSRTTPLATHTMFKLALEKQLPQEVKLFINGGM